MASGLAANRIPGNNKTVLKPGEGRIGYLPLTLRVPVVEIFNTEQCCVLVFIDLVGGTASGTAIDQLNRICQSGRQRGCWEVGGTVIPIFGGDGRCILYPAWRGILCWLKKISYRENRLAVKGYSR